MAEPVRRVDIVIEAVEEWVVVKEGKGVRVEVVEWEVDTEED